MLVIMPLLSGCGTGSAAASGITGAGCQASPPDVVFGPAGVTMGFNVPLPAADSIGVQTYVAAHPGISAGPVMGLDEHLYVGFTSDAIQHLSEVRRSVPDPQLIRAYCARWSNQTFYGTQEQLASDPTLRKQGVMAVGEGGASPGDERLRVAIRPYTPHAAAYIQSRYGEIIESVIPAGPQCGSC